MLRRFKFDAHHLAHIEFNITLVGSLNTDFAIEGISFDNDNMYMLMVIPSKNPVAEVMGKLKA